MSATTKICDYYSESNFDTGRGMYPPFSSKNSQSFTGNGDVLNSIKFYLKKYGTVAGNIVVNIYAHSGTFGTSSVPSGSPVATADVYTANNVSTSYQLRTFNFSDANKITLNNGTKYVASIEHTGADSNNYIVMAYDGSSPSHAGNMATYISSWAAESAHDMCFYVYTDAERETNDRSATIVGEDGPISSRSASLEGASTGNETGLYVYGSATLEEDLIFDVFGIGFMAPFTGNTITSNNAQISGYTIFGGSGSWELQDNLVTSAGVGFLNGTFDANDFDLVADGFHFFSAVGYTPTIIMGSGTWEATGNGEIWNVDQYSGEYVTFTPETSTIKLSNTDAIDKTFYYYDDISVETGKTYNNIWITGIGTGDFIIQGSNTFNDFKVDVPPHTILFTEGTTTTVSTFTVNGSSGKLVTIDSVDGATQHILHKDSGIVDCNYLDISNSLAEGGATWNAIHSSDTENNDGWVFFYYPDSDRGASIEGLFRWMDETTAASQNVVTIAGIDRSLCFINATISIENISSESPSILTAQFFDKDLLGIPELDDEIIITNGTTTIFAGRILEISFERLGASENILTLTCTDYTRDLNRNLVKENYQDMTDKEIIQDIVGRYCIGSGISADTYVSENVTVQNIVFNYMTPSECFKKLCSLSNYNWYIDYNKEIHYFPLSENVSPLRISESASWVKNFRISMDNSNVRNRVYVRGGTYLSDTVTIQQVADGEQTVFMLPEKPHELTVAEGATSKTVGTKNLQDASDYDYLVSYQEKYVEVATDTPTAPAQGTVMTFTFKYDVPVLVAIEDRDSIEDIGQYEFAIFDNNIKTQADARARATAELTDYSSSIVDGTFVTYESGFYSGQYVSVNLPSMGVNENYLIQKVTAKSIGRGMFMYTVYIVNTKKTGIISFLKRMLENEKNIVAADIDEVVDELYVPTGQDIIITDNLISADLRAISTPFVFGTAEWGLAEYD